MKILCAVMLSLVVAMTPLSAEQEPEIDIQQLLQDFANPPNGAIPAGIIPYFTRQAYEAKTVFFVFFARFGVNWGGQIGTKSFINGVAVARHGLILGQHGATACTDLLDAFPA